MLKEVDNANIVQPEAMGFNEDSSIMGDFEQPQPSNRSARSEVINGVVHKMAPMPDTGSAYEGGKPTKSRKVTLTTPGVSYMEFCGIGNRITIKTGAIQGLPCSTCGNFVNTVPVESSWPLCTVPGAGCVAFCLNGCSCWYKRLEHICANCGTQLMVCNKPIRKGCCGIRIC